MFWAPCGSGEGAGGWWGIWGHGGCPHAHACAHMHMHTHTHLYMYRNCKWPPTWKHPCLACLTCMCVCVCVCVCMRVHAWDIPPHTHTNPYPHPPICHPNRGVDPRNHLKFDNTSTYQDISIPFEDLKSVKNSPPMGGCMVWWVVGWVDGWGQVKSLKI